MYVCEGEPWPPVCLLSQFSFLQLPDVWTQSVLPHRYLQAVHRAPALHSGWSLLKATLSASPGMELRYALGSADVAQQKAAEAGGNGEDRLLSNV